MLSSPYTRVSRKEESRGGICGGQFLISLRSRHMFIQYQIGERHVATSKISDPFDLNPERLI